jgi:integrase/recombinase XerD
MKARGTRMSSDYKRFQSKDTTFEELDSERVEDWLQERSLEDTDGTIDRKLSSLRVLDRWLSETDWTVRKMYEWDDDDGLGISTNPAKQYHSWLATDEGYAENSVGHHFWHARQYLREIGVECWTEYELTDIDQTSTKVDYTEKRGDFVWLSVDEYKKLRRNADSFRTALMIEIFWETGIRREELASAQLARVSPDENRMVVKNTKRPKGNKSPTRAVFYSDATAKRLKRWISVERRTYKYASQSDYLFPSNHGVRYSTQHINELVKQSAEEAGIQETYGEDLKGDERALITCHALRHSFATHRVLNGMPISILADLMGDSMETTKRYLQVRDEQLESMNREYRPQL